MLRTFKEYIDSPMMYLDEEKLSRVWKLAQKDGGSFGIITAFRDEFTHKENVARNKELISKVRKAGFGYWVLNGSWIETDEDGKRKEVSEDSLFIAAPSTMTNGSKLLRSFIVTNAKKYDQDSAIFKEDNTDVVKLFQYKTWKGDKRVVSEKIISLGKFNVGSIQSAYSKIRGSGRKFVFEGVYKRNPHSYCDAVMLSRPDLELQRLE